MAKKRNLNELTGNELKLIEVRLANPQATYEQLAPMLGMKNKCSIYAMLKRPRVEKAWQEACAKRTDAVIKAEAKDSVRRSRMTRDDIRRELEEIAMNKENKASDRRAALHDLGEIAGMFVKQVRDVTDEMKEWSTDELDHYARTGERPKRLLTGAGAREMAN